MRKKNKHFISIMVLVCFSFQTNFAGNIYAAVRSDSRKNQDEVHAASKNSDHKSQSADSDYYKLLLNYQNPVTSARNSYNFLNSIGSEVYQGVSLHPELKVGKKILVTLKNGVVRKGKLQELTDELVYISDIPQQKIQMANIVQIEFKKKGIDAYKGALIGLGVGVIVGIVMSEASDFTNTSEYFLFTLLWTGVGTGMGAAAGASGDGGDTVTIVPVQGKK